MRQFIDIIGGLATRSKLFEVVLMTPAETALAPFLDGVTPEVHQWFNTTFRNWLLKQPENLHQLAYLPPRASEKQKKAFEFNDLWEVRLTSRTQTLIGHLMDFFRANPNLPRLLRMSVENVEQAAEIWVKRMNAKAEREPDDPAEVRVVMEYPNGYTMVQLLGANSLGREGAKMGHCVGGYCQDVTSGRTIIYSLRDPGNVPHATIELKTSANHIDQIKGKRNQAPVQRYWPMIRQFLESIAAEIKHDYKNVGLLRISDDLGDDITLTQDQFRDMVLDPTDERGKRFLQKADHGRYMDEDTALGLFVSLYGTERLTDAIITTAFQKLPDLSVQAVANAGNYFTPEQLRVALDAIKDEEVTTIKELLRITKPTATDLKPLVDQVRDGAANTGRHGGANLIVALSQELPQVYVELLETDPAFLAGELAQRNIRAAAPFFVFAGTEKLTPAMVSGAFSYAGEDAMKRIQRTKLPLTPDDTAAALTSLLTGSRYSFDKENRAILEKLIVYAKPDAATLEGVVNESSTHYLTSEALGALLTLARKHVPESVTRQFAEKTLVQIDLEDQFKDYFASEPQPGTALQQFVFEKHEKLLQFVQIIDPSIFPMVYETMRPATVDPKTSEHKNYKNKKTGATFQKKTMVDKDPAVLAREKKAAMTAAIKNFVNALDPVVREPSQPKDALLELDAPKMLAARTAFSRMNKLPLFDLALKYLNRAATIASITPRSDSYGRNPVDSTTFIKNLPIMRIKDIAAFVRDQYQYGSTPFVLLINYAPKRVAELLRYWWGPGQKPSITPWGEFKGEIEKDKAFEALEAVWESNLAENIKDKFAEVVLKRFKPSPAKLISMLSAADNEEVTRKILQKTKKPSVELLDFVIEHFPTLLAYVTALPETTLVTVFKTNPKIARGLMNRDLRGYGSDYKHQAGRFRTKIDRNSEMFKHYQTAAHNAGQGAFFDSYVHQAELDDGLDSHDSKAIMSHLPEYSVNALIKLANNDENLIPIYFRKFSPEKMAKLVRSGLLSVEHTWYGDQKKTVKSLAGISPEKLEQVAEILGKQGNSGGIHDSQLVDTILGNHVPLNDRFIVALLPVADSGRKDMLIRRLTTDAGKDWVADHLPYEMDEIKIPTPHMIEVFYDMFSKEEGKLHKNDAIPYFFKNFIDKWFGLASYGTSTFTPNPVAAQLLKDEAIKRGGQALVYTRRMFKRLATARQKAAEKAEMVDDE